jgi:methylmalonyl-CoA mutase
VDANVITGAYFWNTLPQIKIGSIGSAQFKSFGLVINSSTPVKQIVEALTHGVKMIELLSGEIDLQKIFERIAFSIPLSSDFLQEISKLKALRLLWYQVAQAYGVKNFVLEDLHIHARSESVTEEKYEPHSNMLKGTIAAMAAIIGGSDSLTVCAQHENNKMMDRIARNVSNILREESHLDKVSDPAAGSYVIENIVNDIAEKSWSEFQLIMKAS